MAVSAKHGQCDHSRMVLLIVSHYCLCFFVKIEKLATHIPLHNGVCEVMHMLTIKMVVGLHLRGRTLINPSQIMDGLSKSNSRNANKLNPVNLENKCTSLPWLSTQTELSDTYKNGASVCHLRKRGAWGFLTCPRQHL